MVEGVAIAAFVGPFAPVVSAAFITVEVATDLTRHIGWGGLVGPAGVWVGLGACPFDRSRGKCVR